MSLRRMAARIVVLERTNESGRFLLQLPAGATIMDLLVVPPGFSAVLAHAPIRDGKSLEITVDQNGGTLEAALPSAAPVTLMSDGASWPSPPYSGRPRALS